MIRCDVCDDQCESSICDKCVFQINNRGEDWDKEDSVNDGRISPDPGYILFYQKNGYWPEYM